MPPYATPPSIQVHSLFDGSELDEGRGIGNDRGREDGDHDGHGASDHVESLLRELHSDDDWTLARERAGVTFHFRKPPDSPIHTVRTATTFRDFSPKDFVRLLSLVHLVVPRGSKDVLVERRRSGGAYNSM